MATFEELHILGSNPEMVRRTRIAILKVATQVAGENSTGENATRLIKRQNLANTVFASPAIQAKVFAMHIVSGDTIICSIGEDGSLIYEGSGTLDGDIEFTVSAVWDDRAGVTYDEVNA